MNELFDTLIDFFYRLFNWLDSIRFGAGALDFSLLDFMLVTLVVGFAVWFLIKNFGGSQNA